MSWFRFLHLTILSFHTSHFAEEDAVDEADAEVALGAIATASIDSRPWRSRAIGSLLRQLI